MYTFVVLAIAISAVSADPKAKPSILAAAPLAVAPAVGPPVVTAYSSQFISQNHNALVSPLIAAAPLVAKAAPLVAAPIVAKSAPLVAAPLVAKSAPLVAKAAPAPVAKAAPLAAAPIAANARLVAAAPVASLYNSAQIISSPYVLSPYLSSPYVAQAYI